MRAIVAICMGFFVIQLDATIVNVALPAIQHDVGGSRAGLQWVLDSYTVALAALLLTAGPTADRIGARRTFLVGLAVFGIASVGCAAAPDLTSLIVARTVQGVGAAALLPCSLALIVHEFPDQRDRARALGAWGGISGVGLAAGPLLGGLLVSAVGWRLIFLVNVPIVLATTVAMLAWVRESPRRPAGRVDAAGVVLGTLALAGITAGCIEAGQGGWGDPLALGLLVAGLLVGAAFVAAEARVRTPMVPLDLFASRAYSAVTGLGLLFNLGLYGTILCLSLYLQQSRDTSVLRTGLFLLPLTLVIIGGASQSGRLTVRFGPRRPMLAGMALAAVGAGILATVGSGTPLWVLLLGSCVLGLCSLTMPAMTSVAVGSAGAERAGLASGVFNASRQSGGALGVAVLGSLLGAGRPTLHVAMLTAVGGYLAAIGLAWLATVSAGAGRPDRPPSVRPRRRSPSAAG